MKPFTSLLFLLAVALPSVSTNVSAQTAAAYAVADSTSGQILAAENANKKLQVASLTKIATAMVAIDWAETGKHDVGQLIVVPGDIAQVQGHNAVGFEPGDQVSIRDLLYATLLQSDNRAAYTLANHIGHRFLTRDKAETHPVDLFVGQMNALGRVLGMNNTRFLNPSGIDNKEQPYSTAADMVLLTNYALKRSSFRFYVAQRSRKITVQKASGETLSYNLVNTNALLGMHNIDGVKTGKTARAGECLIISAAKSPESSQNPDGSHTITPRRLTVVVLGATDRFALSERLLLNGWNLYDNWAAQGRPIRAQKR